MEKKTLELNISELAKKYSISKITVILLFLISTVIIISISANARLVSDNLVQMQKLKELKDTSLILLEAKKNLIKKQSNIAEAKLQVKKFKHIFYSNKEGDKFIEELNQEVIKNNLLVSNIVKKNDQIVKDDTNKYEVFNYIELDLTLKGDYIEYVKFREKIGEISKIIRINKEEISSLKDADGSVQIKLNLYIYKLTDGYEDEEEKLVQKVIK